MQTQKDLCMAHPETWDHEYRCVEFCASFHRVYLRNWDVRRNRFWTTREKSDSEENSGKL